MKTFCSIFEHHLGQTKAFIPSNDPHFFSSEASSSQSTSITDGAGSKVKAIDSLVISRVDDSNPFAFSE